MESYTKISKKKRFSEHKQSSQNYKITYSIKNNDFSLNQKSNSLTKNKKLRLHTDYVDYDYGGFHPNQVTSFTNLKPSTTKKSSLGNQSNHFKRKESFNKQESIGNFKLSKNYGIKEFVVNSTKYDSRKNNDLKALFTNPYESKIKNFKKAKHSNYNGSVFLNIGKNKKPLSSNYLASPYSQQINAFLKDNQRHHKSRLHNQSVSKDKKELLSKDRDPKKSLSKVVRQTSTPKQNDLNLICKNNIKINLKQKINDQKNHQRKERYEETQKTSIQKKPNKHAESKINNFFSKNSSTSQNKRSHQRNSSDIDPYSHQNRQDQQSTVKTIKKQQPQFNPKQSSLRQLQSSRVTSEQSFASDDYGLTDEQIETFGDRFPYGFEKIKLLGRGGFSLVWLGKHIKSGKQFAIKQIISNNTHQTHIKEIWFGTMFFTLGGIPKPQFSSFPGVKNLVRLYSYEINQTDTWIFYQKCGKSLGTCLYDIKSQKIYGDEKLYKIHYKPFYLAMQKNPQILTSVVIQICKSLALLSECQIVHSDLKTQNILIKFDQDKNFELSEVKLIDYGSSFEFRNISQFSMATPEYMPPQILNYIIHENEGEYEEELYEQVMKNYQNPWAVDMWSLGCVLLQIIVGVPLWMSLPLLVPNKVGKSFLQKQGLFAVKGRLFPEIIAKQRQVVSRLNSVIDKQNFSKIVLSPKMRKVLKGMLQIDFNKRMSPVQVIQILSQQL